MDHSNDTPRRQKPPADEGLLSRLRRRCANDRLWSAGAAKGEPEQLDLLEDQDDR